MSDQSRDKVSDQDRLEINWLNSAGSALGAVSAAVVLSSLGTAGTLIGAAIGSLVITIGGAVYAHSLRVARQRIVVTRTVLARGKEPGAAGGEGGEPPSGEDESRTAVVERQEPSSARWKRVLRELSWKRIIAASVAVFVVSMGVIVAFELATGRPLAAYTGGTSDTERGTTVPGIGGGGDDAGDEDPDEDETEPSPGEEEEVDEPTEEEPPAEESPAPVEEPTPPPVEEPAAPEETATP